MEIAAIRTRLICSFRWEVRIAVFEAFTNGRIQIVGVSAMESA
jgi:hypothetical protein